MRDGIRRACSLTPQEVQQFVEVACQNRGEVSRNGNLQ